MYSMKGERDCNAVFPDAGIDREQSRVVLFPISVTIEHKQRVIKAYDK